MQDTPHPETLLEYPRRQHRQRLRKCRWSRGRGFTCRVRNIRRLPTSMRSSSRGYLSWTSIHSVTRKKRHENNESKTQSHRYPKASARRTCATLIHPYDVHPNTGGDTARSYPLPSLDAGPASRLPHRKEQRAPAIRREVVYRYSPVEQHRCMYCIMVVPCPECVANHQRPAFGITPHCP
jgi:hypothetical protein